MVSLASVYTVLYSLIDLHIFHSCLPIVLLFLSTRFRFSKVAYVDNMYFAARPMEWVISCSEITFCHFWTYSALTNFFISRIRQHSYCKPTEASQAVQLLRQKFSSSEVAAHDNPRTF